MTDFDVIVPHKSVNKKRLRECCEIMISGNDAYRKWMPNISRRRSRECRDLIVKGKSNEVLKYIPAERHAEFNADLPLIRSVESVMDDLIGHHVKMIIKLATRWSNNNHKENSARRSYYDGGDLVSEGFIAMFDAIRNYNRGDIAFVTYAWSTVNRRMFASLMATSPMSYFNRLEQKMLKEAFKKQNEKGNGNLADAVADGFVTDEEAALVREMLTIKVVLASRIEESMGPDGDGFDFTSIREGASTDRSGRPNDAWELYDFMERAELDCREQDVLLSSLSPFRGWQTECSARHNLSSTSVHNILQAACNKIRRVAGLPETKANIAKLMASMSD